MIGGTYLSAFLSAFPAGLGFREELCFYGFGSR